ncbi:MAG: hypothetical protein MK010_07775 [Erythrobacter sp.]|nr:hypothetical protein [Erythrobacter sp.]
MTAMTHEFDLAGATMLPPLGHAPDSERNALLAARWDAVHVAADAVARLARLGREQSDTGATVPARALAIGGWRGDRVATAIEDLAFVMQTGLRALLTATSTGRDTAPAALVLWREFQAARDAILAMLEPDRLAA